jgi:hypothetical protein
MLRLQWPRVTLAIRWYSTNSQRGGSLLTPEANTLLGEAINVILINVQNPSQGDLIKHRLAGPKSIQRAQRHPRARPIIVCSITPVGTRGFRS